MTTTNLTPTPLEIEITTGKICKELQNDNFEVTYNIKF